MLSELVDGVDRMLYFEHQFAYFVVDHSGHGFNLEDVRVVDSDVEQTEISLFVIP